MQIEAGVAVAVGVGNAFTVTVVDAVLIQPFPSVPVTVYEVVATGDTVYGFAFTTSHT